MYKKVDNGLDFVAREKEVLDFWKENHIFEKSVEKNVGNPEFSFFDGPPTANGRPHIGHILTRVMKDIIPRYKTMKGYHVLRKAGWDTHGLPVELEVENNCTSTANRKSKSTVSSRSSSSAKKAYGNINTNGKSCPTASVTGRIWKTPTSPTTTIISSRCGGA